MNVEAELRRYFRACEAGKAARAKDSNHVGTSSALADEIEAETGERIGDLMTRAKLWPIKIDRHPNRVRWNDEQKFALAEADS